jgi:drug/metabolite transporter (DMT)-like permease
MAMVVEPWYWIAFTLIAAVIQTGRNAMQRGLTGTLGTLGATQVRFLYGLPFGLLFCTTILLVSGAPVPRPSLSTLAWAAGGGLAQIAGTFLMLAAMREKSFVVATALTKFEPVWVALFGLVFLADAIGTGLMLAIAAATAGVLVMSWPARGAQWALRPVMLGLASGAGFGIASIGFRGAIRSLEHPSFVVAASCVLALGLLIQSTVLVVYMLTRDRPLLRNILRAWRPSLLAGALGAAASQGWFLAFALESAARVRTLALVEIFLAQIVSRQLFRQRNSRAEWIGMALLILGVALVLRS